jgi:hypothetical protein
MSLRVSRQHNEVLAAGDGELRVSRQHAEVLAAGEGELRVSRQHVEVLAQTWDIFEENLGHSLNLAQDATRAPLISNMSASNTLNLSQAVLAGQTLYLSASNVMSLASVASRSWEASASTTLSLTSHVLNFHIPNDFEPVSSVINFTQQVDWWIGLYHQLTSDLGLTQQLEWQGPRYQICNTWLELIQAAAGPLGTPWAPIELEDTLGLVSVVNRTQEISANNTINLSHDTYRSFTPSSTLNLVQTVEEGKGVDSSTTTLALTQTVSLSSDLLRTIEHTNIIGHSLTYFIEGACRSKQYAPFIGETTVSGAPAPPPETEPAVLYDSTTTRFKLMYPALQTPTDTVELRAPELDNIDRIAFGRISRETRGGKLTVFADPNWPQVQTVIVTFIGLLKTEVDDLLDFFVAYLGKEIGIQDWEGREWVGVITTPNEAAVQDGKESWTITFEFEGVLVDGYAPSDALNLVDAISVEVDYQRGFTHTLDLIQFATFIKV